jgi:mannose-6-phosphate isomerase-like protein (cupin superfamily)
MTTGVRHVPRGDGETWWVVGDTYTVKATAGDTGGSLGLVEAHVPVDGGPPPHVHVHEDEFFYLLDGELEIHDGSSSFVARAGSFLFVPRGTEHAFRNRGPGPARMLFGYTPAGFEAFFRAVGTRAVPDRQAPPLGPEELARTEELAPRFGLELRLPSSTG